MSTRFVCADIHFSHRNIVEFTYPDSDLKIRPFGTVEDHDEILIQNWNSVVSKHDTVYVLGDVAINKKGLLHISRLNGKKKLILGNHDNFGIDKYREYFYDIRACRVFYKPKFILTHIPIHGSQMERFGVNVHGHLHTQIVTLPNGEPDPQYINVSMEQINFTPLSFDELHKLIEERM